MGHFAIQWVIELLGHIAVQWVIELLGRVSSKYAERRRGLVTSLNELLLLWISCPPSLSLVQLASLCLTST